MMEIGLGSRAGSTSHGALCACLISRGHGATCCLRAAIQSADMGLQVSSSIPPGLKALRSTNNLKARFSKSTNVKARKSDVTPREAHYWTPLKPFEIPITRRARTLNPTSTCTALKPNPKPGSTSGVQRTFSMTFLA